MQLQVVHVTPYSRLTKHTIWQERFEEKKDIKRQGQIHYVRFTL